jgi:hypothetical protein
VIKQFNFYDVYGYLLPGLTLLGFMWAPMGIISRSWPDQDISKAIFLTALAYLLGHVLQTIATNALPSRVMLDDSGRPRFPSDRLLDKSCTELSGDFKTRLAEQVRGEFTLGLHVGDDGDGTGPVFSDRNTAFFLARSYLIARKTAHYVEQFEGLYAMMRGLASALLAGACYLAGWAVAFHRDYSCLRTVIAALGILGVAAALASAMMALRRNKAVVKRAVATLAVALLIVFCAIGFWLGAWQPPSFWSTASSTAELVLWLAFCLTLVAAARCFSAYRTFAIEFAQSAWRDFSVYLTVEKRPAADQDADDNEAS